MGPLRPHDVRALCVIDRAVPAAWAEPNRSNRARLAFVTTSCHPEHLAPPPANAGSWLRRPASAGSSPGVSAAAGLGPLLGATTRCLHKTELRLTHRDYGCRMCTVILAWQVLPDAPLVLAANRDELLARPSDPPLLLTSDPPRWGGRDRLAGGTWLAVDPAGRIGAVTNRHPGGQPPARDSSRHSRGALPLDVLAGDDAAALTGWSRSSPRTYNPVNVLYASADVAAWCTSMDDDIGRRTSRLPPGVHVLTEQDVDDLDDEKTQDIRRRATGARRRSPPSPTT